MTAGETPVRAVVMDFDGIIVDTEPLHFEAFRAVLRPRDLDFTWDEYTDLYMGFDDRDAFRCRYEQAGRDLDETEHKQLIAEKADAFLELVEKEGVQSYPGVVEFVTTLSGRMPLALCSGAVASDIDAVLSRLGMRDAFDLAVTADDVAASKPDPESYLRAVALLGQAYPDLHLRPADCLAVEDTHAGIASARGAGLRVLAVTNSYPAEELTDADEIVAELTGLERSLLQA